MTSVTTALFTALLAVTVSAAIAWFLMRQVKIAFDEFQSRANKRQQSMHSELGRLRSELEALRSRTDEAERRAEAATIPRHPMAGLNLTHRTQALRMLRRGDSSDKVASILGISQTEVELLQKVQRMLSIES